MHLPAAPTIAIVPALYWLRSVMAGLAGFLAVLVLALLADHLLRSLGLPPPAAQLTPELGRQALAAWLRAGCLLLGGLVARAACSRCA